MAQGFEHQRLSQACHLLGQHEPVMLAYLFGSAARDELTPLSDVDIALVLEPEFAAGLSAFERMMFEMDATNTLESASGLSNLDVRVINNAPVIARGTIVREGKLLYAHDVDFRVAFEVGALKEFYDFAPVIEAYESEYLRQRHEQLQAFAT